MSTLEELLSQRVADVEAPKALPAGTYLGIVDGQYEQIKSRDKGTPGIRFKLRLIRPMEVGDEQALAAAGGCEGKNVNRDFYVTDNNLFFVKEFLGHLGIEHAQRNFFECLAESPGRQVGVVLRNELTRGPGEARLIHTVAGTVKV